MADPAAAEGGSRRGGRVALELDRLRHRIDSFDLRDGLCDDGPQMAPEVALAQIAGRRGSSKPLDVADLERRLSLERRRHNLLKALTKEIKQRDLHQSFRKAATLIGEELAASRVIIRSYQDADAAEFAPIIQAEWHLPDVAAFLSPRCWCAAAVSLRSFRRRLR
eukprot:tig00000158_g10169.t1